MQVEVNETNIDKFGLVQLTGNSRETMLSRAAEAAESGYVMSVTIPNDHLLELNIFDVVEGQVVEPDTVENLGRCRYANRWSSEHNEHVWLCVEHGQISKYEVNNPDSDLPCLVVEPHTLPKFDKEAGSSCIYSSMSGSNELFCILHGETSKYDVRHNPGMPCKKVDPVTDDEENNPLR